MVEQDSPEAHNELMANCNDSKYEFQLVSCASGHSITPKWKCVQIQTEIVVAWKRGTHAQKAYVLNLSDDTTTSLHEQKL